EIVSPTVSDIKRTTVLTGKIEPRDEINLKPQISGIISEINVDPGDFVHEGDIIARIKVIPEASQLSAAESRVQLAQINLDETRREHERTATLYDRKFISREEYEKSQTAVDKAVEELNAAQDALLIVKEGVSKTNAQQSNTFVRATITGVILEVPVKVGSSVIQANTFNDGTTIATIADMNNLIFKGKVDETEVGLMRVGMPTVITVGAIDNIAPNAVIEYIAPKSTEENGSNTFELKAAIQVPDSVQLRAGYSANANIILASANNVICIPEGLVEWSGDSTYVYVYTPTDNDSEQTFERRAITTGLSDGINIEVKQGIDSDTKLRGYEKKN
ncbi:MAG: efflux RND transporter periplasmic adaptor subunit, partial [Muribaculum sp.]|nr:efflux RND transporter periplasmic adaptor subunit [Muribaculum sp.]